jgi:hypothetical protein
VDDSNGCACSVIEVRPHAFVLPTSGNRRTRCRASATDR